MGLLAALGATACPAETSHSAVELTCPANLEVGERATLQALATQDVDGNFRWTVSPDGAMGEFDRGGTSVIEVPPHPATRLSVVPFTALAPGTAVIGVAVHVEGEASTLVLRKDACRIVVRAAASPPPQTGPTTTGATTAPTTEPEPPSPPPASLPPVDACALLTADEVGDVLGGTATSTPGASGPGLGECAYDAGASGRVDLRERVFRDEARATTSFGDLRGRQQQPATPIPGIGDEAFRSGGVYAARAGTAIVEMTVGVTSVPGGPPGPSEADLEDLLATAISRVGP
jgi:hypothetical protein